MEANLVSFHLVPGPFSLDPSLPLWPTHTCQIWYMNGHSTQIDFGLFKTSDSLESLVQEGAWERGVARFLFSCKPHGAVSNKYSERACGLFFIQVYSTLPQFV